MLNQKIFGKSSIIWLIWKFPAVQTNSTEDNKHLKHSLKSVTQTFAKFYSNLAQSLLKNHLNSPKKFDVSFPHQYYKK